MRVLAYLRSLANRFLHRSEVEKELEEELGSHLQHRADDLARSGLDRAEAERQARVEFGGRERFTEECREALGGNSLETLIRDVRFSLRVLRKSPSFVLVSLLTLALAIGANAVVLSTLNALVLRPLNVPEAESLYALQRGSEQYTVESYPNYLDLRDHNRSFAGLAAFTVALTGLDAGENPTRAWVYEVSGNYFDVLGIRPYLGRLLHSSDERGPNSAPYIVLSQAYWHVHFQDDRAVVGRTVLLNKHPFTVIGVAPPEFQGTLLFFRPDFYIPIVDHEQVDSGQDLNARGPRWIFMTLGHLKVGVTPEQAIADLDGIGAYLEKTYPRDDGQMRFSLARPSLMGDFGDRPIREFVTGLMLLAGLILLAASANLGNLFAARAADRSREVALRLALGSSRGRVVRQLFTEALLLSLAGGACGLGGSVLLLRWLSAWRPFPQFPINVPVNPDARVYAAALLLALACGILFGAVPVKQVLRTDPYQVIKSGAIGTRGRRITVRDLLLAAQIAICAMLVTSSIVAVRGLMRSLHSHLGFEPEHAMLVETVPETAGYRGDAVATMQKRMIAALETIPGVTTVGLVGEFPPVHVNWQNTVVFNDAATDLRPANAAAQPVLYKISPEYFRAAGTALQAGRTFSWSDDQNSPRVAVVNQEFARKIFGSATGAVGKYFKRRDGLRVQVVGIVQDGKYTVNLAENPQPVMFLPFLQWPTSDTWMVVRSARDAQPLAASIQAKLRELDAGLPSFIQTWNRDLDGALFGPRVATAALGVLGVMGAMLSIAGIFGMAAYSVSRRRRELGIRMALGAQRQGVLGAALGRAFRLLAWGSAAGLLLGMLASRVLSLIVYQATPRDPLVLAGVVLAMLLVGLAATWIPAQRALSIEPSKLLHEE